MTRAKIIDVSQYQEDIKWQEVQEAGVVGAAIRCTVGNYYTDPLFTKNWDGAKAVGIRATAYHVMTPEYSAISQIDRFENVMEGRELDWAPVLDVELSRNKSNSQIVDAVFRCVELTKSWAGRPPIIYTAKWWWNQYMIIGGKFPEWAKSLDLWLAGYPWDPTPPAELSEESKPTSIPGDWDPDAWKIWQWTAKGRINGIKNFTDFDIFNGSVEEFGLWAGGGDSPPPPPAPDPAPVQGMRMRVIQDGLRVRTGPGTLFAQLGSLKEGDIVEVLDIGGAGAWVEISPGQWANVQLYDDLNMEKVE